MGKNTKAYLSFYSRGFAPFAGKGGFAAELGRFGETTLPFFDRRCRASDSSFVLRRQGQITVMTEASVSQRHGGEAACLYLDIFINNLVVFDFF